MNARSLAAGALYLVLFVPAAVALTLYAVAHRILRGEWPEPDFEEEWWE